MRRIPFRLGLLACAAALAAGCAAAPEPKLAELYAPALREVQPPPVVFVPGLLGARLADARTGQEVWPRSALNLLTKGHRSIAAPIGPVDPLARELVVTGLFDSTAGHDFYGNILRTLEQAGGYRPGVPGEPVTDGRPRYYVFLYDWRRCNVAAVREFDRFVAQIRRDYGQPDLRVDVVAHSQGGLIVRYYARYGTEDVLDGRTPVPTNAGEDRLRRVVLLGTPNLGTVESVRSFVDGFKIYGTGRVAVDTVLTMPAAYQLLPHPGVPWIVSNAGEALPDDVYDVRTWQKYRWGVYKPSVRRDVLARFDDRDAGAAYLAQLESFFVEQLERSRRLAAAVGVPNPNGRLRYAMFGGDCTPTPARIVIEPWKGDAGTRLYPHDVTHEVEGIDYHRLIYDPGDGLVTKASLLGRRVADPVVDGNHGAAAAELAYPVLLCEDHNQLAHNATFHDNLLDYLLR
jgi:pimeloyl-ACP methyl ester carboxylesterase